MPFHPPMYAAVAIQVNSMPFPCAIYLPLTPPLTHSIRPPIFICLPLLPRCPFSPLGILIPYFQLLDKILQNRLQPLIPPRQQHDIVCLNGPTARVRGKGLEILCCISYKKITALAPPGPCQDAKRRDGKDASKHKYLNKRKSPSGQPS
jgi:hypothetical protein